MNKQRRKELWTIQNKLYSVIETNDKEVDIEDIQATLADIQTDLEYLYSEEESCMDNMPENLQNSSRYYDMEEACDNLDSAVSCLSDALSSDDLDDIISSIEETIKYIDDATM